jgi:hypothetical protein
MTGLLIACEEPAARPISSQVESAQCEDLVGGIDFGRVDSAGVDLIANLTAEWTPSEQIHVGAQPRVSIGVTHGDPNYEFGRISAATIMKDGRIVVADAQSAQLNFFDSAGKFMQRMGGRGSGPGEHRTITGIYRTPGDTLWVDDFWSRRLTKLSPSLEPLDVVAIAPVEWVRQPGALGGEARRGSTTLRVKGILADGNILAANSLRNLRTEEITNVSRDSLILRRLGTRAGTTDSLQLMLGLQLYEYFPGDGGVWFGEAPFGHVESMAVAGDRYYYGSGTHFEIEEHAPDGRLLRLIRLCEEPDAIDADQLARVIDDRLATYPAESRGSEERALRGIPQPSVAPSYLRLLVDEAERLWVQDFTYPGERQRWKVFGRSGRWLGDVDVAANATVLEVGSTYLLARRTDELGVQSIHVYPVTAGSR